MRFFDMTENPRFAAPASRSWVGCAVAVRTSPSRVTVTRCVRAVDLTPGDVVVTWSPSMGDRADFVAVARVETVGDDATVFSLTGREAFTTSVGNPQFVVDSFAGRL